MKVGTRYTQGQQEDLGQTRRKEADDFDSKILKGLLVLLYEKKEGHDLLRQLTK